MKKIISTILIIAAILSIALTVFFYKAPKAKAIFGIGDISIDIVNQIKEWVLDQLPKSIVSHVKKRLFDEISRWAQGGFSDENKPFAMTNWKDELKDIANIAGATFVNEFHLAPLCAPIKVSLGTALGLDYPAGVFANSYPAYAACTLQDVVNNVEAFYKNPSIEVYGWDSWTALTQSQNNIFGSVFMALQRKEEIADEETQKKEKEIQAGQGVKNETICTETQQEACAKNCMQYPAAIGGFPNPVFVACIKSCEKSDLGVCLKVQTKKLGSEIKASVDSTLGAEMNWLISANEITAMIDIVFSGLFTKLTHGVNGLMTKIMYNSNSTVSKNQLESKYYQDYQKTKNPEDLKQLRAEIMNNIGNSVKQLSAAGYECDADNQLQGDVYSEMAAEIIDQESQHLYSSMEGVNLKPDFIVLDGQPAVNNGIAIYGTDWNDIPFNKYPEKCEKIANKQCKKIITGLPYELNTANINAECVATGCHARINEYRAAGDTDNDAINKAVADGKCSSFAIGNECLQGGYLIDNTKNKCGECLKGAQETCEFKETAEEKTECIKTYCGNYKDISSSIKSAQDFYNRCSQWDIRNGCEVCLMEYFMPADYCGVMYDFVNRAFVKYPVQVKEDLWWGRFNKFADCANNRTASNPWWLSWILNWAPFDVFKVLYPSYALVLENLPLAHKAAIPVGLTCRILPDFVFPGGGTCKTLCNVTDDELKDIGDDEPGDLDCLKGPKFLKANPDWGSVWESEGFHPGGQYLPYLVKKSTKCCAGLMGHDKEAYKKCRGVTSTITEEEPPPNVCLCGWGNPECCCAEGWRPVVLTRTGYTNAGYAGYGGDCSDAGISLDNTYKYFMHMNNDDTTTDVAFIAAGGCSENDETLNNTDQLKIDSTVWPDAIGDGLPDVPPNEPDVTTFPSGVAWSHTGTPGEKAQFCIQNVASNNYIAGVYHNDNQDIDSGIQICQECRETDTDYPNYGTPYDQCTGKPDPLEVPAGCE